MKNACIIGAAAILFLSLEVQAQPADPGPPNWITAKNKPCKIWNPQPQPNESVTWSGACKNGLASGKGVLHWTENGVPDAEFDGEYADGKRNGPGVIITPDGERTEGNWVDDQPVVDDSNAI
jgi:MORN repeat